MDFSPEELDVSPPCFLVENSQTEESQQLCRSDSDRHLAILKRLPVFAVSTRDDRSTCSTNESIHRNPVARSCPTGGGESGGQEEPGGEQRDGAQEQGGGGGSRGDGGNGGDNGAGDNGGAGGGYGGGDGGGDDGGDGGGGDGHKDNDNDNEDESAHAEEPSSSSSSDALPSLIRPEAIISNNQWKGHKFSAPELRVQQAHERGAHSDLSVPGEVGQQGSLHESSGDNDSQASTGIVGEGADVAADMPSVAGSGSLSEASTAPIVSPVETLTEKKSTSSSSTGNKSEQGSSASSSIYHGDLSSLSSGGSLGPSPDVRKHLPLHSMLRTQSTSNTSSSSAGSKEEKVHGKVSGFKIWSVEEKDDTEACSSQEDLFTPRDVEKEQEHVHSDLSADGSHILPPQHHSTPSDVHSSKRSDENAQKKSLYQQVLTAKQRTSTPVEGGEFISTPPSQGTPIDSVSGFQSLQFSGEVSAKETSSSSSGKVSLSPEEHSSISVLVPSSPTAVDDSSAKLGHQVSAKETSSSSSGKVSLSPEEHSSIPVLVPSSPTAVEDKSVEEKASSAKLGHQVSAKETSSSSSGKVSLSPEEHSSISVLVPSSPTAVEDKSAEEKASSAKLSHQVSAKETSSSSSGKVSLSPEEHSSIPVLVPSSPTAVEDKPAEEKVSRKEKRSESSTRTEVHEDPQDQSEMARVAAALVESFDLSQEERPEKTTSVKHKETSDDDEVTLPRWQQLQKIPQQDSVSNGKKSSSSNPSSEGPSFDDAAQVNSQPPDMQQWQSVISAIGSTNSSSQGTKMETAAHVSTSNKEQLMQKVDMSFLESTEAKPLISKAVRIKETPQGHQSLSPSSLVLDPFNADDDKSAVVITGPTQPEMSIDLFRPSITQESAEHLPGISEPAGEPMEEDHVAEESQEIVFSLHLTQSQTDLDSQAPFETSLPMEENQEEVTVTEMASDVKEDNSTETTQKEKMVSLTKQDSSSQSILAPLVQPRGFQALSSVTDGQTVKDKELVQQQPNTKVFSDVHQADNVTFSHLSSQHEEAKSDEEVDDVPEREVPHPSTEDVTIVSPPEQPILAEDSGEVALQRKEDTSEDLARPQLRTPEKDIPERKPIKPRLPATIFSETSSESVLSGGFHFSLPKEPLRPLISTTPPPIRPARQDTPDSQERGSRCSIIPDVLLPVVTETPGMSSQAPPSSLDQVRPQSLTVSMPRHGSPVSDSENSEPVFRFHTTLHPVSTSPGSSAFVQPSSPEPQRSIFSRARDAIAKNKKREVDVDNEHNPFAFTAEDEDPEPLRKRVRRSSPRGGQDKGIRLGKERSENDKAREALIRGADEGPSFSGVRSKEQDISTKYLQERELVSAKRGRHDESSESSESEGSEKRESKRARKEEEAPMKSGEKSETGSTSEAVHYRQIIHTRTVTTVTTQVQRVVTVRIVDKESGEVVEVLTYEEDERPKIESEEKEKEEVDEFVESSSLDGSRVMLTSKSPKRQELKQQSRSSPRINDGKTPVATKSTSKPATRSSDKTQQAVATPGKSGTNRGGEATGELITEDRPQSRNEPAGEIPAITRQATVPVTEGEPTLQRTSSSESSLTPGTRVLAKWLDGFFYQGVITTKQYKNGRYLVTFDDGDKRRIPRENIIIKDLLPAGQSVMAQGDAEDDYYEQGIIIGHYRDGDERGYEIQTQSGAVSRFPRNRVILSEQQAATILSSESSLNVTSGSSVSIGAHSLRLRKDRSAGSSGASLHNIIKSGSTGRKDTSLDTSTKDTSGSSSEEKTRGKKAVRPLPHASPKETTAASASADVTPKSTCKSSHKAKAQLRRAGHRICESESSSDEQHGSHVAHNRRQVRRGLSAAYAAKSPLKPPASDEPLEPLTRSSPRKQLSRKEDDRHTGSLPANRNIFAGLAFLVTGVVRDRNDPDESDSESERIEFNRDDIRRQIEAGGGVVLSSFPQSQISGAECFLVSGRHQRTQKYFQSLASGIPCVSHMWIHDCCACEKRLYYKKYMLPAGESLEVQGEIVECRPRINILGNMRVYLHGSQQFKDTWSSVLLAAGCKMVTKIPNHFDYQCDVVICEDNKLHASVKHAATLLGIPIVSLEWLLQSLINGRQVPFDGHPKYDYRYKSP